MLSLTVNPYSAVVLTLGTTTVRVVNNSAAKTPMGFEAPKEVRILREELIDRSDRQPPRKAG